MTTGFLVNGAVLAAGLSAIAFALSRFTRDVIGRSLLVFFLVAALAYVSFAIKAGEGAFWIVGEVVGVAIYGAMGLRGLRGSPWWLAGAWALHPVWDVLLHYVGPGGSFAPVAYAISCLSFDLVVAAYIAIAYGFGLVGSRRPALRESSAEAASTTTS